MSDQGRIDDFIFAIYESGDSETAYKIVKDFERRASAEGEAAATGALLDLRDHGCWSSAGDDGCPFCQRADSVLASALRPEGR